MGILERARHRFEHKITPEQARRNAAVAQQMFIKVSIDTPASVTAQAAGIAYMCQEQGLNPRDLFKAISQEPERIAIITRAAVARHRAAGKGPTDERSLNEERARNIMNNVFGFAYYFTGIPHESLEKVPTVLFSKYIRTEHGRVSESFHDYAYRRRVMRMIKDPIKRIGANMRHQHELMIDTIVATNI